MSFYITFTPTWMTYPAIFVFLVGIIVVSAALLALAGFVALRLYWWAAGGSK